MLTPVDNPAAYGLVETDAEGNIRRFLEKPKRRRDHLQHDQRRHLRARARHVRPHPEGHALVDRAQLLPVADRARRDVRRLRLPRLLDRHRHAGEVHRRCTATSWTAAPAPAPFAGVDRQALGRLPDATVEPGATLEGPCFIDDGAVIKAGARIGPTPSSAASRHVEEGAQSSTAPSLAERRIGQSRGPRLDPRPQLPHRPQRRRRAACRPRRQDRSHRLQPRLDRHELPSIPSSSRPTTSAGSTRPRSTRTWRARSAAASSPTSGEAHRGLARHAPVVAVARRGLHRGRPRRRAPTSSTTGMIGTDMMYFAVARDGHDGGAQITASHNPKQYNGMQAGAARGASRSAATPASATSAT